MAAAERRSDWDWLYFSDSFKSRHGESLRTALYKYGVGGLESKTRNMVVALIFLDSTRSASHSWLLAVKTYSGAAKTARLYENDNDTVEIPCDSVLGEELRVMLRDAVFEES